ISWNSHFTDLRLAITNPTSDDYQRLDLSLIPDKWVHKAGILDGPPEFALSTIEGNVIGFAKEPIKTSTHHTFTGIRTGSSFEMYDNVGNVYVPLASTGYRLRCATVPSHSTIKIVFALVQLRSDLNPFAQTTGSSERFGVQGMAFKGI